MIAVVPPGDPGPLATVTLAFQVETDLSETVAAEVEPILAPRGFGSCSARQRHLGGGHRDLPLKRRLVASMFGQDPGVEKTVDHRHDGENDGRVQ